MKREIANAFHRAILTAKVRKRAASSSFALMEARSCLKDRPALPARRVVLTYSRDKNFWQTRVSRVLARASESHRK